MQEEEGEEDQGRDYPLTQEQFQQLLERYPRVRSADYCGTPPSLLRSGADATPQPAETQKEEGDGEVPFDDEGGLQETGRLLMQQLGSRREAERVVRLLRRRMHKFVQAANLDQMEEICRWLEPEAEEEQQQ